MTRKNTNPNFAFLFILPCLKKDEQFLFALRISLERCSNSSDPEELAVSLQVLPHATKHGETGVPALLSSVSLS